MSIEKCSSAILKHEAKPYTMIFNEVIQKTRNPFATFIWIYLQSLPEDWVVNYSHLKKHFKIGDDKLKQSIRWLEKSGLLLRVRPRLPNGLFGPMEIQVKNGLKFTQDESSTSRGVIHPMDQPPGGEHPPLTNTTDIKKEKEKISATSVDNFSKETDQIKDKRKYFNKALSNHMTMNDFNSSYTEELYQYALDALNNGVAKSWPHAVSYAMGIAHKFNPNHVPAGNKPPQEPKVDAKEKVLSAIRGRVCELVRPSNHHNAILVAQELLRSGYVGEMDDLILHANRMVESGYQ